MRLASILLVSASLAAANASAQNLLYDNGPLVTHPGGGSGGADASALDNTQPQPYLNIYGYGSQRTATVNNWMCDDFHSCGAIVNELEFFGYQTSSGNVPTINAVYVQIFDGDPSRGGTPNLVWGDVTTNRLTSAAWSGIYRTLITDFASATARPIMSLKVAVPGLLLPPGQFWVQWQYGGTTASGPWCPPVSILGRARTGNARQFIGATPLWQDCLDGITTPVGQAVPFKVYGVATSVPSMATLYGAAKVGTNGLPVWAANRPFTGMWNYEFRISNGVAGASPVVLLGTSQLNFVLPGIGTLLVNPLVTFGISPFDASNVSRTFLDLPPICTGPLDLQAVWADGGAAGGICHTGGLELFIGN